MKPSNKEMAKKVKEILGSLGHDIPLGHVYEMLSKLSGERSWNIASAKGISFVELVQSAKDIKTTPIEGSLYRVVLHQESDGLEIRKDYLITATSEKEARKVIQEYIDYQTGEIVEVKTPQAKELIKKEEYDDFIHNNWVIIDNSYIPKIREIYKEPNL